MSDRDQLAQRFETHRERLRAIALRMLGSSDEADDAVQEAWLRLSRTDAGEVANLGGWLTTVVSRVCLDMLRARVRRQDVQSVHSEESVRVDQPEALTPEDEVLLADSIGAALLVLLDTLEPVERLVLVLHDMFGVPFDEIAPIVGRTPIAARKLASRARVRLQADPSVPDAPAPNQRHVVGAFLAAARHGDFASLLELLDPEVVFRADAIAVAAASARADVGAPQLEPEMRGPDAVLRVFRGGAKVFRVAQIDGLAGAVWSMKGRPQVAIGFTVRAGSIMAIEFIADPETLAALDVEPIRG